MTQENFSLEKSGTHANEFDLGALAKRSALGILFFHALAAAWNFFSAPQYAISLLPFLIGTLYAGSSVVFYSIVTRMVIGVPVRAPLFALILVLKIAIIIVMLVLVMRADNVALISLALGAALLLPLAAMLSFLARP